MRYTLLILIGLLVASCTTSTKQRPGGKRRTTNSAPYELLLVCDKAWLETSDGSILKDMVYTEIPALPAPESNFKVISINPEGFSKTFQGFANIIVAEFGSQYKKAEVRTANDLYAHPQRVVYLTAPDSRSLAQLAAERGSQIINTFVASELERERDVLKQSHSSVVLNAVNEMFGFKLYAPASIDAVKKGKDFVWASSDAEDNRLNICVYTLPFNDGTMFGLSQFIEMRDSVMKINIEGERPGQYMTTNAPSVIVDAIEVDGNPVFEARGLWEMEGDMMGGPFVSHVRFDSESQKIIITEGFVFAPEKKKRPYIRELEAALQTLKIE